MAVAEAKRPDTSRRTVSRPTKAMRLRSVIRCRLHRAAFSKTSVICLTERAATDLVYPRRTKNGLPPSPAWWPAPHRRRKKLSARQYRLPILMLTGVAQLGETLKSAELLYARAFSDRKQCCRRSSRPEIKKNRVPLILNSEVYGSEEDGPPPLSKSHHQPPLPTWP